MYAIRSYYESGRELHTLAGHEDAVYSAAFSPDGQRIVTASWDQTARIWEAETGRQLHTLAGHEELVFSAVFSPDGRRILTASDDKTARIWDVAWLTQYYGDDLIAAVCEKKLSNFRRLTHEDILAAPILRGREGEDVCAPPSFSTRACVITSYSIHYTKLYDPCRRLVPNMSRTTPSCD